MRSDWSPPKLRDCNPRLPAKHLQHDRAQELEQNPTGERLCGCGRTARLLLPLLIGWQERPAQSRPTLTHFFLCHAPPLDCILRTTTQGVVAGSHNLLRWPTPERARREPQSAHVDVTWCSWQIAFCAVGAGDLCASQVGRRGLAVRDTGRITVRSPKRMDSNGGSRRSKVSRHRCCRH